MGRFVSGGALAAAALLWGALGLEAQVGNDVNGPSKVYVSDSSSLYTSTVTTANNFLCTMRVKLNGVQKHYSRTYIVTAGPTYALSKVITGMNNWGMIVGDELDYTPTFQGAQGSLTDHHHVMVEEDPITLENRSRNGVLEQEAIADRWRGILA